MASQHNRCMLVTGAVGFVGRAIVDRARANDSWTVRATDRHNPGKQHQVEVGNLGALLEQPDFLSGVDAVVHCMVDIRPGLPEADISERNFGVLKKLLSTCQAAGVSSFILVSSSTVLPPYAWKAAPEKLLERPRDAYGGVRWDMEKAVLNTKSNIHHTAVLRPHIVLGPSRAGIFETPLSKLMQNRLLSLPAMADEAQSVVHVDDLARCVQHILRENTDGILNIGTPCLGSPLNYFRQIAEEHNCNGRIVTIPNAMLLPFVWMSDRAGLNLFGPNRALLSPDGFRFAPGQLDRDIHFSFDHSEADAWWSILQDRPSDVKYDKVMAE